MKYIKIKAYSEEPIKESDKDVKTIFTQYMDESHTVRPAGNINLTNRLRPMVYNIGTDMKGLYFTPRKMKSDGLLRFKDKRQTTVINEIDNFWKLKNRFDEMNFIHKRGLLLYGSPGTGKSCILKLVINDMIKRGDIILTVTNPSSLVSAIDAIRQVEPTRRILAILEDVDEMVKYNEQALLGLFDGDSQQDGVVFLGTTNYLDKLPPRMVRVGRFDRVIEIGTPGRLGRKAYIDYKLKEKEDGSVIDKLVEVTKGFNFSQLKEVIVSLYCLGYSLQDTLNRIKNGFENIKSKRVKYLDSKLNSLTSDKVIQANVEV